MPYLGRQPSIGRFAHLDDITSSFNSVSTTFSLTQATVALVPGAASNLIISLGGVLQEPEVAYTVTGSSIIFSSAPANTQPFFGILLGDVLDVGQVSQGAVINATSLTVTGAATLSNTLAVTGATTLSNTLAVTGATTLSSTVATGALTVTGAATYTTSIKSTTALATPGALNATQATAFASTVSGAAIMGFGTTNDVSLMNRAGTVVLGVGPNTTAVNIPGTLAVTGTVALSAITTIDFGANSARRALTITGTGSGGYNTIQMNAKTSGGAASNVEFGMNGFADNAFSISDGTTERLRLSVTTGNLSVSTGQLQVGTFPGSSYNYASVSAFTNGVVSYYSSDRRLKKNIEPIGDGLTIVRQLRPSTFDLIADDYHAAGFIAQDVLGLVPGAATITPNDGLLAFNVTGIVAFTAKAIQELDQQLTELKAQVAALRAAQDH